MSDNLADLDYPNKPLVVIGPDGRTVNRRFSAQTHYDQIYNHDVVAADPKPVSGSFSPVLNYSQFLTRHAPHPFRVRHMKGLLDNPICNVNDEIPQGQQLSKYQRSISTPERAKDYFNGRSGISQMDVAIRLKKPQEIMVPPTERGSMRLNMPDHSGWHSELTKLTQRSLPSEEEYQQQQQQQTRRASNYSRQTGRLNETPMRNTKQGAGARNQSRASSTHSQNNNISASLGLIDSRKEFGMESEALVMELLSQLLGTESVTAVQTWLCNATDQEKSAVAERVRQVVEQEIDRRSGRP